MAIERSVNFLDGSNRDFKLSEFCCKTMFWLIAPTSNLFGVLDPLAP